MRFITLLFVALLSLTAHAQQSVRKLAAHRTTASFKIDGDLSEPAWKEIQPATDFVEWRPNAGKPEENKTVIYLAYDNTSLYIGGYCYEKTKDSISRELIGRDRVGVNDFVGVIIDTYHDKINAVGFYVTPYGEQYDAKYSQENGEDDSWDAVWNSSAKMHADGWSFEMSIPYSALRFVSKENQTWGLNITRRRNKTGQQFMWNPIDPKINGFVNQEGEWTGIGKIDPPVRLSLSPYFSAYVNHFPSDNKNVKDWSTSVNGGMDVKYGISESFTLDMTLIPDFGQVRSDNRVLNLSPFEIRLAENRPFFTEGTELFSKGGLFYSRRIGATPLNFSRAYNIDPAKDTVLDNPVSSRLINATKVSGRTRKGLGIGVFNAVTQTMYATVQDKTTGQKRKIETGPLTNYNIMVFDQTMKNNSSVSFINTNVLREGHTRDANVSAALFNFNNKKNTYNLNGKAALSQIHRQGMSPENGYTHSVGFGKTGGTTMFNISQELMDEKYNHGDLGIMRNNNYLDHYLWIGQRWVKPGKWFNRMGINFNLGHSQLYKKIPGQTINDKFQSIFTNINGHVQFKNLWFAGFYVGYNPRSNDFYEPRYEGLVFRRGQGFDYNVWAETNSAKRYYVNWSVSGGYNELQKGRSLDINYGQRFRFNDKLSVSQGLYFGSAINNIGFYNLTVGNVGGTKTVYDTMSLRTRNTVEGTIEAKYNFNKLSGITFIGRHYWSKVQNERFFELQPDGSLKDAAKPGHIRHQNYNNFYINVVYTLQFAPGSFINIVWKDEAETFEMLAREQYLKNLDRTITSPQNNNLSIKVIYFLDYLDFKKWRSKKKG